jgi:uncharacterized spore protein YtfJ
MSSLDRLFEEVEKTREAATWQAAFGQPQQVEDKTLIPVAQVGYGWGLGFGSGSSAPEGEAKEGPSGEGGGGGGGGTTRPLGALVVTPAGVDFEATLNVTVVAVAALAMMACNVYQITKTIRAFSGGC